MTEGRQRDGEKRDQTISFITIAVVLSFFSGAYARKRILRLRASSQVEVKAIPRLANIAADAIRIPLNFTNSYCVVFPAPTSILYRLPPTSIQKHRMQEEKNHARDKKNHVQEKKNHAGEKKNRAQEKKNHAGEKKNRAREKKNHAGEKKNRAREKKNPTCGRKRTVRDGQKEP
jgi:hypothetical protein